MLKLVSVVCMILCALLMGKAAYSQQHVFYVDTLTNLIDAQNAPFNKVKPGDTVCFKAGLRAYILIRNFKGESGKPIIFINDHGQVTINTDHYFGISVQNCRYIRLTGSGDKNHFYGFSIERVSNGTGIGIGNLSSDFEIDHFSIRNVAIGGIYAKTDPDCSLTATRDRFTQFNTLIHDNYIENCGNEGLYIGSTKYFGQTVNCDGHDTLLMPPLLDGVRVYNNIIKYSGWDGIQVSSASNNCQVYDNLVMFDSQAEVYGQMSGIIIGGGSKCDCYNNFISQGKGNGIEIHGLAGFRVFNNIIIDAGRSFAPSDVSQMKHGIFVTDVSAVRDSSFSILFNTILHPKSDGIRFASINSSNNLVASNAIINPGTFDFYEFGNTHFKGVDAYIMIPDPASEVLIKNNYTARNSNDAGFAEDGFSPTAASILINSAWSDTRNITSDYFHFTRPYGDAADIGAVEYNPSAAAASKPSAVMPAVFPNPVNTWLTIRYNASVKQEVTAYIYNTSGLLVLEKHQEANSGNENYLPLNVENLPPGVYIYSLKAGNQQITGKFIKTN